MNHIYAFIIVSILSVNGIYAQMPPDLQWQRSLGGSQEDYISTACKTTDGGSLIGGATVSDDGFVHGHHGREDMWLVRLNADGDTLWTKCLGGSGYDIALGVQQTADGGFIITGSSTSTDGDVHGNHGGSDIWVVKLNAGGDTAWTKCYGGTGGDYGFSIRQTPLGGYILAARTESNNGDIFGLRGGEDIWLARLNPTGSIIWNRCMGGTDDEIPRSIRPLADGTYILAGITYSNDLEVSGNHGSSDYWIVKVNAGGAIAWQKCFGGSLPEEVGAAEPTADGGFIVSGGAMSNDGDVQGHHGFFNLDAWILKLDAAGEIVWQKCLGGTNNEQVFGIQQTTDGGYVSTGPTNSNNFNVSGNHGQIDIWAIKLAADGELQWQRCFGGSDDEYSYTIFQTADRGYFIAGGTRSSDMEISNNNGMEDIWALKLDPDPLLLPATLLHFSAHAQSTDKLLLQWKTSSEINCDRFEIQRSTTGNDFEVIGQVGASGNSSAEISYTYADHKVPGAERIFYRLRIVDADGRTKFSPVIMIKPAIGAVQAVKGVFPNPAISQINLSVQSAQQENITIQVVHVSGRVVGQQVNTVGSGTTIVPINISRLATGIYSVKTAFSSSDKIFISQFIKR